MSKKPQHASPGRKRPPTRRAPWEPLLAAAQSLARWEWLLLAALAVAVLLVYQPAWRGGILWDDDQHITLPSLRSWQGLWRIWFDVGATLQYYPVLHSAFWIEHRLWGNATLGYHLVNILLHATAAFLVALTLRRLAIPGAYLAAAIFALHPVHAESVAWITEQKNTLSAVFYLGAMLVYLHFDQTRRKSLYWWAMALFLLAVFSKTVTATLPGGLLVIFWWQRGRLSWRKDVVPLLPFFLLGAGGGLITAWWELKINNCVGPDFQFTPLERLLIAGRAIWFHLGKLCWPVNLTFIYTRWQIDTGVWWQWAFPLGVLALAAGLWSIRRWSRAPLAALLFFVGTLFPVLGFFNLYTFRYSLVANHYQYLASLGAITLAAAGAATLWDRWRPRAWPAGYAACLALLALLAGLTWQQSRMYADVETLYTRTIEENPECTVAHSNLGSLLQGRGKLPEAMIHYRKAISAGPHDASMHNNIGAALAGCGRLDDAMALYQKALEIRPDSGEVYNNRGAALLARGRLDEAMRDFQKAVALKPDCADAQSNLGLLFANRGQLEDAIAHYRQALAIQPDHATARANLEAALQMRQVDAAIAQLQQAVHGRPADVRLRNELGMALVNRGRWTEALAQYRRALELQPDDAQVNCNLAWLRASCAEPSLRNGAEAVALARRAVELTGGQNPIVFAALAAAQAEAGQFPEAVAAGRQGVNLALQQDNPAAAKVLQAQLSLYEAGKPFRHSASAPSPGPKP
jgi:tetratricopeptide (TPR) repeat protein